MARLRAYHYYVANCHSYVLPFENGILKSPVFRWIRYSGFRYIDGYCTVKSTVRENCVNGSVQSSYRAVNSLAVWKPKHIKPNFKNVQISNVFEVQLVGFQILLLIKFPLNFYQCSTTSWKVENFWYLKLWKVVTKTLKSVTLTSAGNCFKSENISTNRKGAVILSDSWKIKIWFWWLRALE